MLLGEPGPYFEVQKLYIFIEKKFHRGRTVRTSTKNKGPYLYLSFKKNLVEIGKEIKILSIFIGFSLFLRGP